MRGRGSQNAGPLGPGRFLILFFGRHRHQVELIDLARPLAARRSDAVAAGITAADHNNVAAGTVNRRFLYFTGNLTVLFLQQIQRKVNTLAVSAGNIKVTRRF